MKSKDNELWMREVQNERKRLYNTFPVITINNK